MNKTYSNDQPTCGMGLAEYSTLPAKLGELMAAIAENLEFHMKALDLNDPNSRREFDAYQKLSHEHRMIAAQLTTTAKEMAGYRDLPMGKHDMRKISEPVVREAFKKYTNTEQELLDILGKRLEKDQELLRQMA